MPGSVGAHKQNIAYIKRVDNKEENHRLINIADRVAKHKDKSQQNCCDSCPHFGNINLFIAAEGSADRTE